MPGDGARDRSTVASMGTAGESGGVVLFRRGDRGLEVLIAHPGGPFWARKDEGAWSIPKGEVDRGETPFEAALREFREETGVRLDPDELIPLGTVTQRAGKVVHAWAAEGDADPNALTSSTFSMEWPPRSGRTATFPEIDRVEWVSTEVAARKLNPAQAELIDRLVTLLGGSETS